MADAMGHPDEATWERLAAGELDASSRDAAFDHITGCPRCSRIWRGVVELRKAAEAEGLIPRATPPKASWLRSPVLHLALAATLVVVVGGLLINRRAAPDAASAERRGAPLDGAPPIAVPPAPPAVGAPAPWLSAFPLTKADIHVTPQEALAPRGVATASDDAPIDRLAAALEPYRRDDFAEAAAKLDELWRAFPAAGRPALYLGVSLLHLNRNADALAPLRSAILSPQPEVAADAHWYLSVALARTGQREAAAAEATPLCRAGGADAPRACAALKALQQSRP